MSACMMRLTVQSASANWRVNAPIVRLGLGVMDVIVSGLAAIWPGWRFLCLVMIMVAVHLSQGSTSHRSHDFVSINTILKSVSQ